VAEGIKFIDGHACSGSSIPASAVYAEAGVLMMSPASSNPVLTDAAAESGWPTIMRLYTRDDAQGAFIGPWIAEKYKDKNVVILHDKSAYGQGVADAVKATMNTSGLNEVMYEGINAGDKDYSALVTKMKELKADVVYFGGYHPEAGLILRQSAEQGFKFQLIMPDSIASPEFWQVAGPAGEGTMFVFPSDPQSKPEAKEAVEKIKASGFVPEGFTLFSYAVVQAVAQGIERAGTDDPMKVAEALKNGEPISTVVGQITFDEKGDIKDATYDINQWHDGQYAPIKP
jgi:branched-chain amino acid transport system substrate-binding protein